MRFEDKYIQKLDRREEIKQELKQLNKEAEELLEKMEIEAIRSKKNQKITPLTEKERKMIIADGQKEIDDILKSVEEKIKKSSQ